MGMIFTFCCWLGKIRDFYRCGRQGHTKIVILTRYEEPAFIKFLGNLDSGKIRICKTYTEKCYCGRCGTTFLRRGNRRHGQCQ